VKTFFICADSRINFHVDEEYDDYIQVEDIPTSDTLNEYAHRIQGRIRGLQHQMEQENDVDKREVVTIDAIPHYAIMMDHIALAMKRDEKITVEIPEQLKETKDAEED